METRTKIRRVGIHNFIQTAFYLVKAFQSTTSIDNSSLATDNALIIPSSLPFNTAGVMSVQPTKPGDPARKKFRADPFSDKGNNQT